MGEVDSVLVGDFLEPEHDMLDAEEAQRAALKYLEMGWAVTAGPGLHVDGTCACKAGKRCRNPGKHAYAGWGNEERRTLTPNLAERYWSPSNAAWESKPVDQVFIVPYLSGLIVADVDRQEIWDVLEAEDGKSTPETLFSHSGSGRGGHYLYKFDWDTTEKNPPIVAGKLPRGGGEIKFRGIIAAPPCPHKSGGRYMWGNWGTQIEEAPSWMTEEPTNRLDAIHDWDTIVDADKSDRWIKMMFTADVSGLSGFGSVKTSRPLAMFAIAASMAKWIAAGWITEDQVVDKLLDAAVSNGSMDDYGSVELTRQIKNGIRTGMMEKRS